MKELSIEEKAKAYDEAIERAKEINSEQRSQPFDIMTRVFPELKESKGERIRKEIARFIRMEVEDEIVGNKWIAWLEKQGENKPAFDFKTKNWYVSKVDGKIYDMSYNPSDKAEPRFHEGDWICHKGSDNTFHINKIENCTYISDEGATISFGRQNDWRLWTIQDAKSGDVLFHSDSASNGIFIFKEIIDRGFAKEIICYCDYDSEDHFCLGEHHTCCWTNAKILHPATKEQRCTLFKAMADAGWQFDFEKKELKKIENEIEIPFSAKDSELQEVIYNIPKGFYAEIKGDSVLIKKGEQKSTWSEEDERYLKAALFLLKNSRDTYLGIKGSDMFDWLKSLKQRIG